MPNALPDGGITLTQAPSLKGEGVLERERVKLATSGGAVCVMDDGFPLAWA